MRWPRTVPARLRALGPARLDALTAGLLVIVALIELPLDSLGDRRGVTYVAAVAICAALAFRRRATFWVVAFQATVVVVQEIAGGHAADTAFAPFLALMVAMFTLAARSSTRELIAGTALMAIAVGVIAAGTDDVGGTLVFGVLFAVAFPVAVGLSYGARTRLTQRLRERAMELELDRERRARDAVAAERRRIAGELHDVVTHSVSVMVVQAAAARRLVPTDPERAREAMVAIEHTGREALNEMRRLLGILRRGDEDLALTPQPTLKRLDLIAQQSGMRVDVTVEGDPPAIPPGLDVAAYRVVQEALRAMQRAGGDGAAVTVRYSRRGIDLEVSGDAAVYEDHEAEVRLLGTRERIALFGGELTAGRRRGGGWGLRARLPLPEGHS
ncbi:MAG: sensor histidine kinase [Actinobacteria bacterium]|nr:MAG: sensor histidine kinase [Actinomycetota bacterium]